MDKVVSAIRGKEHNMKSNIVLIGMPGVGKSTIGVVLAKNLGYHFMDSDIVIQQQTGKLLHEIITEKGLDGFLQTEDEVNAGIDAEKTVIATGGSAVFGKHAMQHLAENGTIISLSLPYEQKNVWEVCISAALRLGRIRPYMTSIRKGSLFMKSMRI